MTSFLIQVIEVFGGRVPKRSRWSERTFEGKITLILRTDGRRFVLPTNRLATDETPFQPEEARLLEKQLWDLGLLQCSTPRDIEEVRAPIPVSKDFRLLPEDRAYLRKIANAFAAWLDPERHLLGYSFGADTMQVVLIKCEGRIYPLGSEMSISPKTLSDEQITLITAQLEEIGITKPAGEFIEASPRRRGVMKMKKSSGEPVPSFVEELVRRVEVRAAAFSETEVEASHWFGEEVLLGLRKEAPERAWSFVSAENSGLVDFFCDDKHVASYTGNARTGPTVKELLLYQLKVPPQSRLEWAQEIPQKPKATVGWDPYDV